MTKRMVRPGAMACYVLCLLVLPTPAAPQESTPAATRDCAALLSLALPDVHITEAVAVDPAVSKSGAPAADVTVPHCRVSGTIGTEIGFVELLPAVWNGRLAMGGTGGFAGSIDPGSLSGANHGYATVATNTGHQAFVVDARWAIGHPDRLRDYAFEAVHRTALTARAIARAYYGSDPRYAYLLGCSNGGRMGLMEAQRYPDDFDGIVSGAPAADFTALGTTFVRNLQAIYPDATAPGTPVITAANLRLLGRMVREACDTLDGVRDSVIDDPRRCTFKAEQMPLCTAGQPSEECVTPQQRAAIARVYEPLRDAAGHELYPGQPLGAEDAPDGWNVWITGPIPPVPGAGGARIASVQGAFGTQMFGSMVFGDTAWDFRRYDLSRATTDTRALARMLDADNPDLRAFARHGGRLILWHGWADPAISALGTIRYYERVQATTPRAGDVVRLFLLPGVLHCSGGPGPDSVDWTAAIAAWREQGKAPDQVQAARLVQGKPVRTRPLCAYPARAVYSGKGSTDEASSFTCKVR